MEDRIWREERWYLTLENIETVTQRIATCLEGQVFTVVKSDNDRITVRTSQRLAPEDMEPGYRPVWCWFDKEAPPRFGGIQINDGYGTYSISTGTRTQADVNAKTPIIAVENRQIMVEQKMGDNKILWIFAPERRRP